MILRAAQVLLTLAYAILPVAFFIGAIVVRYRRGRSGPLISYFVACTVAALVGIGLLAVNAQFVGGHISTIQSLQFIYFVMGAICLLKLLDYLLLRGAFRVARVRANSAGNPIPEHHLRAFVVLFLQRVLIFCLIISYVAALVLTYRPRVLLAGDPSKRQGLTFAPAQFVTRDGLALAGWWIPAPHRPVNGQIDPDSAWGQHTVVLCHGIGSAKEHQLSLARYLVDRGYNVLVFDFRAHGESDGSFISYGSRERYDVLAAVQWAKANHAEEARRVFGVGSNIGAAALLAAAADPEQGQQLDALVLYEPYARFRTLASTLSQRTLPPPVRWLVESFGMPIASLHAGANLRGFAPVDFAGSIWPRPILLVHGRGISFVPVYEEMDLYRAFTLPKRQFWPAESYTASRERLRQVHGEFSLLTELFRQWIGTSMNPADDPAIQQLTQEFLMDARPLPAI